MKGFFTKQIEEEFFKPLNKQINEYLPKLADELITPIFREELNKVDSPFEIDVEIDKNKKTAIVKVRPGYEEKEQETRTGKFAQPGSSTTINKPNNIFQTAKTKIDKNKRTSLKTSLRYNGAK